jgi:hypothetical protein
MFGFKNFQLRGTRLQESLRQTAGKVLITFVEMNEYNMEYGRLKRNIEFGS